MNIRSNLTNDELLQCIYDAAKEYEQKVGNTYLLVGRNKGGQYFYFECAFNEENFMHLLGINNRNLGAAGFYKKCIECNHDTGNVITISQCIPARGHNRQDINEKASCCADILNIENARFMSVAGKDKISLHNDFEYAYGSQLATLGFKKINNFCVPTTLSTNSIDVHTSRKYRVFFIFKKQKSERRYGLPIFEKTAGLFYELRCLLPDDIQRKLLIE